MNDNDEGPRLLMLMTLEGRKRRKKGPNWTFYRKPRTSRLLQRVKFRAAGMGIHVDLMGDAYTHISREPMRPNV